MEQTIQLGKIQSVLGRKQEYFIFRKKAIEEKTSLLNTQEEKKEYLTNELSLEFGMKELLQSSQQDHSIVDQLNSFSAGILAVNEVIQLIREKLSIEVGDNLSGLMDEEYGNPFLTITEVALLVKYLQDNGAFIKKKPHQTERLIHDLVSHITGKSYDTVRKAFSKAEEIKQRNLTQGQIGPAIKSLVKVKDSLESIEDPSMISSIEALINHLELNKQ